MDDQVHFRRIRPRIHVESPFDRTEINNRIKEKLSSGSCSCEGKTTLGYATIFPAVTEQHYWSPQLTITIEDLDEGSLVRGLYGPRPSVWTMFVFFYSAIGFLTMITLMVGLSYWTIGTPSKILWFVPILILLFLSLYLVAYFGQKMGHKQMGNLHSFIEECLDQKIEAV